MEQCTGTIYNFRTAILYLLIDSFPISPSIQPMLVVDGTPEAEVRVEWDEGVNRPANLNETLKGESATLENGTFTSSAWSLLPTASAGQRP